MKLKLEWLVMHLAIVVDGAYTTWSTWSGCSVTCGNGTIERTRTCTNPQPQFGGTCAGDSIEYLPCVLSVCIIISDASPLWENHWSHYTTLVFDSLIQNIKDIHMSIMSPSLPGLFVQSCSSCSGRVELTVGIVSLHYANPAQAATSLQPIYDTKSFTNHTRTQWWVCYSLALLMEDTQPGENGLNAPSYAVVDRWPERETARIPSRSTEGRTVLAATVTLQHVIHKTVQVSHGYDQEINLGNQDMYG